MEKEVLEQLKSEIDRLLADNNGADAIPLIRQAAHWGDLRMQILAADIYTNGGYSVLPNPKLAFEYTRLAALNGSDEDTAQLGIFFKEGRGTAQDYEKAFYFLNKAAEAKVKAAYDPLAVLYMQGQGTARNLQAAEDLLYFADENDPNVIKHLKMLELLKSKAAE